MRPSGGDWIMRMEFMWRISVLIKETTESSLALLPSENMGRSWPAICEPRKLAYPRCGIFHDTLPISLFCLLKIFITIVFLNSFIVHLSNHKIQFLILHSFLFPKSSSTVIHFVIKTYAVIHTKASGFTPITQILIIICWLLLYNIITFYFWRFFYFQHILHIYITGHNCISQTLETSTQSVQGCTWFIK